MAVILWLWWVAWRSGRSQARTDWREDVLEALGYAAKVIAREEISAYSQSKY